MKVTFKQINPSFSMVSFKECLLIFEIKTSLMWADGGNAIPSFAITFFFFLIGWRQVSVWLSLKNKKKGSTFYCGGSL